MNVKELIEHLQTLDENTEVLIASDAEGNEYSKIEYNNICEGLFYIGENCEIYPIHEDDEDFEEYDDSVISKAIAIYPI